MSRRWLSTRSWRIGSTSCHTMTAAISSGAAFNASTRPSTSRRKGDESRHSKLSLRFRLCGGRRRSPRPELNVLGENTASAPCFRLPKPPLSNQLLEHEVLGAALPLDARGGGGHVRDGLENRDLLSDEGPHPSRRGHILSTKVAPSFTTMTTLRRALMSAVGSPSRRSRSASFPVAIVPRASVPRCSAAPLVAILSTFSGAIPAAEERSASTMVFSPNLPNPQKVSLPSTTRTPASATRFRLAYLTAAACSSKVSNQSVGT